MTGKQALVLVGLVGAMYAAYVASKSDTPSAAVVQAPTYTPIAVTYAPPPAPPAPTTYRVQDGDGWYSIAKANGVTMGALLAANGATGTDVPLYAGQVLQLPSGSSAPPAGPPPMATATAWAVVSPPPQLTAPPPTVYSVPPSAANPPSTSLPGVYGYGEISPVTGLPRTQLVHGYTKQNGKVVEPYYRSPRRH